VRFTISAGVAVLAPGQDSWEALLQAADEALYLAKGGGRNRTVLASQAARGAPAL
jgi:PleD family two-component response regulator